jgi:hypothetical protein
MSYLFEHHDRTIWPPSKVVAELLLANVRSMENRLDLESGLTEYMSDTVEVECDTLAAFLLAVRKWANPDNPSMEILIRGVVIHLVALLLCGDVSVEKVECAYPTDWIEDARVLARTNTRALDLIRQ